MVSMNIVSNAIPVSRAISPEAFLKENVLERKPILIKGALKEWKALQWTPEYLKQVAGSEVLSYRTEEGVKHGNFGELIDRIFHTDKPAPYLRNLDLARQLPILARDIGPELPYCSRNWRDHVLMPRGWPGEVRKDLSETFISRKNASFPYLHIDYWGMSAFSRATVRPERSHLVPGRRRQVSLPHGHESADFVDTGIRQSRLRNVPGIPACAAIPRGPRAGRFALQSGLVAHHEDPGCVHYRDLGVLESTRVGRPAQPRSHPSEPEVPLRAASLSAIRRHVQPALAWGLIAALGALRDHLIVGDAGRYFSFREAGSLTAQIADGVRA